MKKLYIHSFKTRLGTVRTAATEKGLAIVALPGDSYAYFEGRIEQFFPDHQICHGGSINKKAERQITAFLEGKLRKFAVEVDIQGTPFQRKVLRQVARIPYGRTMTYGEVARAVGHPRAYRAVGSANARSTLPLVIPCHRVVASNGPGGYGGAPAMKKKLLRMEGAL